MKILRIILSRIYFYYSSNKLIFILFAFGCFICAISFTYFYGNTMPSKILESKVEGTNYFAFDFKYNESLSELRSSEILSSDEYEDVRIFHNLTNDEIPAGMDEVSYKIGASLGLKKLYQEKGRVQFTEKEKENGENVVILPQDYDLLKIQLGDKITLCGSDFEVIGFHSDWNQLFVPEKTLEKMNLDINSIEFFMKNGTSRAECSRFISEVDESFPIGEIISSPLETYEAADTQDSAMMISISIIYIISITSFMFLMKHMMDKSSRENIIYSIVGASKKKVLFIMVAENAIIVAFFSGLAVLVHMLFYDLIFSPINTVPGITYNAGDYLLVMAFIFVLSLLVFIPFVVGYMKNSLIENKNKYNE